MTTVMMRVAIKPATIALQGIAGCIIYLLGQTLARRLPHPSDDRNTRVFASSPGDRAVPGQVQNRSRRPLTAVKIPALPGSGGRLAAGPRCDRVTKTQIFPLPIMEADSEVRPSGFPYA